MELTEEERVSICLDVLSKLPLYTFIKVALLRIGEKAVEAKSDITTLTMEANYKGNRYEYSMELRWKCLGQVEKFTPVDADNDMN